MEPIKSNEVNKISSAEKASVKESKNSAPEELSATATVEIAATQKELEPLLLDFETIQKYHPLVEKAEIVGGRSPAAEEDGLLGTHHELTYFDGTKFKETVTEYTTKNGVVDYIRFELSEIDGGNADWANMFKEIRTMNVPATLEAEAEEGMSGDKVGATTSFTVTYGYKLKRDIGSLAKLTANRAKQFVEGPFEEPKEKFLCAKTEVLIHDATQKDLEPLLTDLEMIKDYHPLVAEATVEIPPTANGTLVGGVRRLTYKPNDENPTAPPVTFKETITEYGSTNGVVDHVRFQLSEFSFPCRKMFAQIDTIEDVVEDPDNVTTSIPVTSITVRFDYQFVPGLPIDIVNQFASGISRLVEDIAYGAAEKIDQDRRTDKECLAVQKPISTGEIQPLLAQILVAAPEEELEPLLTDLVKIQEYHPYVKKAEIVVGGPVAAVRRLTFKEEEPLGPLTFLETVIEANRSTNGVVDRVRFELSQFDDEVFPCEELFMQIEVKKILAEVFNGQDATSFTIKFEYKLKEDVLEKDKKDFIDQVKDLIQRVANGAKKLAEDSAGGNVDLGPIPGLGPDDYQLIYPTVPVFSVYAAI